MTFRQVPDRLGIRFRHPDVDELLEGAVRGDHAERAVAGIHQGDGDLGDAAQHVRQLELLDDDRRRGQQVTQPALGVEHALRVLEHLADRALEFGTRSIRKPEVSGLGS